MSQISKEIFTMFKSKKNKKSHEVNHNSLK